MTAPTTQADDLQKLRDMVKDIDFCMLTTIDEDGDLRSRPMSVNGDIDPDGDLWFFTAASSHKVWEVQESPMVNVSFADPKDQRYVSISGTAELVRDRGKIEEAIETVRGAIYRISDQPMLWNTLATILSEDGRVEDGLVFYAEALRLDPTLAAAYSVRARHLAERGDFERAVAEIRRGLELDPNSWEVNREAARQLMQLRRVAEAARHYTLAASLDENVHIRIRQPRLRIAHCRRLRVAVAR